MTSTPSAAERCTARSLTMGEPMPGSASVVRSWLLVEHPGAWSGRALDSPGLPPGFGARLHRLGRAVGARVLLIRRVGRSSPAARHCFIASSGQRQQWVEGRLLTHLDELFDLDLAPLARGEPVGLDRVDHPLFLICTHGSHDVCCAERGRPLAAALAAAYPDPTWEVSHIGGDRFAGNLVCLPEGVYYGRVDPADAPEIAKGHCRGVLDLDHYRGRSCYDFAVQAAEHALRRATGRTRLDDLVLTRRSAVGDEVEARFRVAAGTEYAVRVRRTAASPGRRLTCKADRESRPPAYVLVALGVTDQRATR